MDSREELPRVSLASVHDWYRLKANYKSTALASLQEHIISHGLAAERDALLAHTNQVLYLLRKQSTPSDMLGAVFGSRLQYGAAQPSYQRTQLRNTRPERAQCVRRTRLLMSSDLPPDTEPFDEALDRRIWSLADTRLQWQKRIAETRRTMPQEIEATVLDLFEQQRVADADTNTALHGEVMEDMEPYDLDAMMPRHSHIEEGFHKTVALGEELEQTTVSQEERAERARVATTEVKVLKH
ncbi:hypothetical protein DXG01_006568 [Tephrocybe rancida]|nr:hypothetical protein DXG01_006568 [Tephrocybe rancida]